MFRMPCDLLDPDVVKNCCVDDEVSAWVTNEFILLDSTGEDHACEVVGCQGVAVGDNRSSR
jgi:hypothetical protein